MSFPSDRAQRCRLLATIAFAVGLACSASAQTIPPGFSEVPRPPGTIGGSQNLMPPGASSGVLAPPPANPSPLQLAPPSALPPAPPPSSAAAVPAVPMVPAGQIALMVNARFGREPPNITAGLHWRVYPDKPDGSGVFRMLREERTAAPIFVLPPGG
jgi:hypothetical protein